MSLAETPVGFVSDIIKQEIALAVNGDAAVDLESILTHIECEQRYTHALSSEEAKRLKREAKKLLKDIEDD